MKNKTLKSSLKNNSLTIGCWITIPSVNIIEILSQFNFDWLCIDTEHNLINNEKIVELIRSIQSNNIAALVRVSSNNEVTIKQCMDAGADGVVVPMINSYDDAKKIIDYTYYPPIGKRGVGLSRAQKYGSAFEEYKNWLNKHAIVIAQIEHYEAIENLEKIISLKEIDGLLIGPYDLSSSMGYPGEFNRDDVQNQINKFKSICEKNKISHGLHIVDPEIKELKTRIKSGYNFIAYGTDFNFLKKGIKLNFNLNE